MKHKKNKHSLSESDDKSSDNETVASLKRQKVTSGSGKRAELLQYSVEHCEFCEDVFYNKYNILVHTAKHIIIPLINLPCFKCTCGRYYASGEDLQHHNETSHHVKVPDIEFKKPIFKINLFEDIVTKQVVVNCEDNLKDIILARNEKSLEKIVMKEAVVKCDGALTELLKEKFVNKKSEVIENEQVEPEKEMKIENKWIDPVNDGKFENKRLEVGKLDKQWLKPSKLENKLIEPDSTVNDVTLTNGRSNIRSKLIFEDDDDDFEDDIIQLNDFGSKINSNLSYNDNSFNNLTNNQKAVNNVANNSKEFVDLTLDLDDLCESVHYEELMVPGDYECQRCSKWFPNRYNLVIHEATHVTARQPKNKYKICRKCDYYIVGNYKTLRNHMIEKHAEENFSHMTLKQCNECGLSYYHYDRHHYNYHFIYGCKICFRRFKTESERFTHVSTCKGPTSNPAERKHEVSKLIKVCELCFSFFKNTQNFKYVVKGVYSRDGLRTDCERCEKPFFELKLVEMSRRMMFWIGEAKKRQVSNNKSRLKSIQNRLKMINKRNRV